MESKLKARTLTIADYLDQIATSTLPEFFTEWDRVTVSEVSEFEETLKHATLERQLQAFFLLHRHFLAEHLAGGHGRWVIPSKRLGSHFVTDFIIGEAHSLGFDWCGVELEGPEAQIFTKNGDPSAILNHAIRQITDWRVWLQDNLDHARRPESENGLGLTKIRANVAGLILIGRRATLTERDNRLRAEMSDQLNIAIHTYDYILDAVRRKVKTLHQTS